MDTTLIFLFLVILYLIIGIFLFFYLKAIDPDFFVFWFRLIDILLWPVFIVVILLIIAGAKIYFRFFTVIDYI